MEKHIIVTSKGQNPSDFISYFGDNVNATDGGIKYEIALKEIYHAPLFNITSENNTFELTKTDNEQSIILHIPPGFYENNFDILEAINATLRKGYMIDSNDDGGNRNLTRIDAEINYDKNGDSVSIELDKRNKLWEFSVGNSSPLLRYLGYIIPKYLSKLNIPFTRFHNTITPAFIYASCVGNSIFDSTRSRLLATVRLSSKSGYNHFEVLNPSYVPLAIQSLRDINFVIMNLDGEKIDFDYLDKNGSNSKFPIILKLHVRKML